MSRKKKKWKYTRRARKLRYCDFCGECLDKEEPILCRNCFHELLRSKDEPTEEGEEDE